MNAVPRVNGASHTKPHFRSLIASAVGNRHLIVQLIKREVLVRYRGSALGLLWSFMHPLLMLLVYMFVFGIVFRIRWGGEQVDDVNFGVVLFSGLIVHALFAECLVRAPGLVVSNPHFVKKVVFPLEILPLVSLGTALFHMSVGLIILLIFNTAAHGVLHWTLLFIPVVIAPLAAMVLGVSWFLASLGVFIRDINQIVGILATVLLFLCPVFYPLSAVPEAMRPFLYLNPLTVIVEEMRRVVIFGQGPDWNALVPYTAAAVIVMWGGYWWFSRTRTAFADVV